jgi:hypothetical protein
MKVVDLADRPDQLGPVELVEDHHPDTLILGGSGKTLSIHNA